jgi:hypothetical protein
MDRQFTVLSFTVAFVDTLGASEPCLSLAQL